MWYTSRYIFSLVTLVSFSVQSQEKKPALQTKPVSAATDTVTAPIKTDRYGIRIGADLHRLSRSFYEDGFTGFEVVADYRLSKKMYAAGEIGNVNFTQDDPQVNYTTKGSYVKIGFDYNAYDNWLDMENMLYIGVRYGFSSFSQNLNSYKIYQNSNVVPATAPATSSNYFDEVTVNPNQKYSSLTAQWVEFVAGIKAEIFHNIFLGFSVRLNSLISDKKPVASNYNFDNLYIPGFNRTYDGTFGVGFNYTLSYFVPLYKKKNIPKEKEVVKKKK